MPYYIVFSRYTHTLRFFQLVDAHYQEQPVDPEQPRLWLPALKLGLGVWEGEFEGISRQWLRWYDAQGDWIATDTEQALEQVEQRADQAETQLQQTARNLLQAGMSIAQVSQLTGLPETQG